MNKICVNVPSNSTTVMIFVPIGSADENPKYKGISHFLEHMSFKGTKTRTAKQLASAIENIGGEFNAYTCEDLTAYHATVQNSKIGTAITILQDMLFNSVFSEVELNKERNVIIQELKMYEDDPKEHVNELFNKQIFLPTSRFYLPVIGTRESLARITRKNLVAHYKKYLGNMTMVIVGNVKNNISIHKDFTDSIIGEINTVPTSYSITNKEVTQANVMIGGAFDEGWVDTAYERSIKGWMASSAFNGMAGRLFTVIREQNNLVYRIRFYSYFFKNGTHQWCVSLGLDKDKIEKAHDLILQELKKPFTSEELEIMVEKTIGQKMLYADQTSYIASSIASMVIAGADAEDVIKLHIDRKYITTLVNENKLRVQEFMKQLNVDKNITVGILPEDK